MTQPREARHFPPYRLLEEQYVDQGESKNAKLKGIYKKTQTHAWDGDKMLAELMTRHGGVQASPEVRRHIAAVFSVILWGELAAWNIAADLALTIDDIEAKMAASGQ